MDTGVCVHQWRRKGVDCKVVASRLNIILPLSTMYCTIFFEGWVSKYLKIVITSPSKNFASPLAYTIYTSHMHKRLYYVKSTRKN